MSAGKGDGGGVKLNLGQQVEAEHLRLPVGDEQPLGDEWRGAGGEALAA